MNVIRKIADLEHLSGPLHLAIGVFDGLHLGHQAVIQAALDSAAQGGGDAVAVTFDPHPVEVIMPRSAPRLLCATSHKLRLLQDIGIRHVLMIPFDREFASLEGREFVELLVAAAPEAGVKLISVGEDWRFGAGRRGDVQLLEELGGQNGFEVSGAKTVEIEGVRASSTRIREAVASGDFGVARKLLGRDYTVFGTVVEGQKLGRTIGFPTANLAVHSEQLPPTGVYAVRAYGAGDSWDGVANLGYRPTVEGGLATRLLEVHLFGLEHEIYGEDLEVEFVQFLRGEMKFEGIEALKMQIEKDARQARSIFRSE